MTPINIGGTPNDGSGDTLRAAFGKVNALAGEVAQLQADPFALPSLPRGAWAASTVYAFKDIVTVADVSYIARIVPNHTSGASFSADLSAGKWGVHQGVTALELAASDASTKLGHVASGSGSVARTVKAKLDEIISSGDAGADPTGVVNAAASFADMRTRGAGRKLIKAGTYLGVATYPYDVIESDLQLFPTAVGGTDNRGVDRSFYDKEGSLRVGGSDTAPTNDERGFWTALASQNAWGNAGNRGLYSVAFNRNGASYGYASATFGHDCIALGVTSIAGGAGSATGNTAAPAGNAAAFTGYCAFAWGKNALAKGQTSFAWGERCDALARGSYAGGYYCTADVETVGTASDGIGATAMGFAAKAYGRGATACGIYVEARAGSTAVGSGINPGSPMVNSLAGSVGFGANVTKPTFLAVPGAGVTTDYGYAATRGKVQWWGTIGGVNDSVLGEINTAVTNSGSGGSGGLHLRARLAGAIVDGFAVATDSGVVSLLPMADNAMRVGSAALRPSVIYAATGSINTSDARLKTALRALSDAETRAALRLADEIGAFAFLDAVAEKGDAARVHIGLTVQRAVEILRAEGLDPGRYAFICHDAWEADELRPAGDLWGFRADQLALFVARGLRAQQTAIEARLSALEKRTDAA